MNLRCGLPRYCRAYALWFKRLGGGGGQATALRRQAGGERQAQKGWRLPFLWLKVQLPA